MTRRELLKIGGVAASAEASSIAAKAAVKRPNFLFLIADDLTYRGIHALGNPEVQTPHLDRLVRQGCAFTHAFQQGSWLPAVCVASRTMLNTGVTAFRAHRNSETLPLWGETFGANGYATSIVGKWHLSKPNLDRAFKQPGPVSGGMFESGPDAYNRPHPGDKWVPWDTSLKGQWQHTSQWRKTQPDEIRHSAAIWADEAIAGLNGLAKESNPFLMYVGFNSPHDPRQAPREFVDRYPHARIEVPPNYLPEHPFDNGFLRGRDELLAPFPRTKEAVQLHRAEYYAHTTYMDEQIGRILSALEASGAADNTYVIFTADHGLAVGQHGLMGKQNPYDHSIRMPLLLRGPGIQAGTKVDQMVYQHSVFPTACELAGVSAPSSIEFPSIASLAKGGSGEKHDAIFSHYQEFQRVVRTREHKLIVYPKAGVTQLFDLQADPWETKNLADEKRHATLKRSLLERLRRLQAELGDDVSIA